MDTSYNDIPYMGRVHHQTHIERMALAATLFGMESVDIHTCRVLELGCGDGSNLLNMAINLPNATFVGVDGSSVHIDRANNMSKYAKSTNVEFHAMDINDVDESFGNFDYIICHGVFSWVPENVRAHILKISRERLTPNGIGYISYNAYPAWKQHEMLRDMMRFHAFRMDTPKEQIAQARALIQFIGTHVPDATGNSYGQFLQSQVEFISGLTEEYLYHEYLETYNQPFWFYEFIKLLDSNHLQYLGDTDLSSMLNLHWPEETRDILNDISPTQYELEQYMDMLRCRRFRCSLFVHHAREVTRSIEPQAFMDLYYSYKSTNKWDIPTEETTDMEDVALPIQSSEPQEANIQAILFQHMHNIWPKRLHFNEIIKIAEVEKGSIYTESEKLGLAELLQTLYLKEIIQAHHFNPSLANHLPQCPTINGVARFQATYQEVISTQLHDMVIVRDEWVRSMVQLMDGMHTLNEIVESLYTQMTSGDLPPLECTDDDGEPITDSAEIRMVLKTRMIEIIHSFLENGALMDSK